LSEQEEDRTLLLQTLREIAKQFDEREDEAGAEYVRGYIAAIETMAPKGPLKTNEHFAQILKGLIAQGRTLRKP